MWLGHNPYYRKWSVKSQEVPPPPNYNPDCDPNPDPITLMHIHVGAPVATEGPHRGGTHQASPHGLPIPRVVIRVEWG